MKKNQVKKSKKQRKRNAYEKVQKPIYLAPPTYVQQEVRSIKVRCTMSGAAANVVMTATQIASLTGVIATAATTGVFLSQSFRMKRLCCWGPVATAGTPVTVELKYADIPGSSGGIATSPKTVSDTSVSFDRPAYCCLTPEKDGYFDNWLQCNNGSSMLDITCPAGSTLDFDLQFILDDIGTQTASRTLAGATAGELYRLIANLGAPPTLVPVAPINSL